MPLSLLFSEKTFGQSPVVKGNISTRTAAVRYALVTFVNTSDTSLRLSALTDTIGNFQLNLTITSVKPGKSLPTNFRIGTELPKSIFVLDGDTIPAEQAIECKGDDLRCSRKGDQELQCRPSNCGCLRHSVGWKEPLGRIVTPGVIFLSPASRRQGPESKKWFSAWTDGQIRYHFPEWFHHRLPSLQPAPNRPDQGS